MKHLNRRKSKGRTKIGGKPTDDTLPKVEERGKKIQQNQEAPVEEVGGEAESNQRKSSVKLVESQPPDKPKEESKVEQV